MTRIKEKIGFCVLKHWRTNSKIRTPKLKTIWFRSLMHTEPKFYFKSSHWLLEKKVQEKNYKKNGNWMRFRAIYMQYLSFLKKKKQKFPLFAFVYQCLSRNLPQIDLNRIINYYTRKFRKNWDKKWNVECDIDENFKDDQVFITVVPAIMFLFELWAKFLNQNVFLFISTNLFHVDLLYKRLSHGVKR
jgi:hypothetical protein